MRFLTNPLLNWIINQKTPNWIINQKTPLIHKLVNPGQWLIFIFIYF